MAHNNSSFMRAIDIIAVVLIIVGGLNWGLVGFFGFNLVAALFGEMSALSRLIYALVGLSALYRLVLWRAVPRRLGYCPTPNPKAV